LNDGDVKEYVMPGANGYSMNINQIVSKVNKQYQIKNNMTLGTITTTTEEIYESRKNGIFLIASGGGLLNSDIQKYKSPVALIKYPIKINDTWSYTDNGGKKITRKVIGKEDDCTVNSKKYEDILKIRHTINDAGYLISKIEYYANGIGLIKEESEDGKLMKYLK